METKIILSEKKRGRVLCPRHVRSDTKKYKSKLLAQQDLLCRTRPNMFDFESPKRVFSFPRSVIEITGSSFLKEWLKYQ